MREILFRGKCFNTEEWVEGYLGIEVPDELVIQQFSFDEYFKSNCIDQYSVKPETVGQYTGLKDKNGLTKIFEYDIIDANGRKVGNYYENSNLLKDGTCLLIARMGTKEWSRSEQEAIKRGCKYAE